MFKRLDEDSSFTLQNDTRKLLKQLSNGSRAYYAELTGINGPYHHLQISDAILAGINKPEPVNLQPEARLQTTLKNKRGYKFSLENCLQELWKQEKSHVILFGDGGMGKTVSLIHFWEMFLKTQKETIPIFLTCMNTTASETERHGFITKRIVWHYLRLKVPPGEYINAIWDVFKTASENGRQNIVLLLDGFNEVTVEHSQLMLELK